jgi:hypothetical protein
MELNTVGLHKFKLADQHLLEPLAGLMDGPVGQPAGLQLGQQRVQGPAGQGLGRGLEGDRFELGGVLFQQLVLVHADVLDLEVRHFK